VSADDIFGVQRIELAEVLSHVLDKGVVLRGEVMLAVADVDLIRLDLGLLLSAVETAMRRSGETGSRGAIGAARPQAPAELPSGSTMESQVVQSTRLLLPWKPLPRHCLRVLIQTPTKSRTGSRSSS